MQDWLDDKGNYIDFCVEVGDNFKIGFNNVLGRAGFGFEKDKDSYIYPLKRREHNFGVVIGDNVEIGSCNNIDRGRWRDTQIGNHTKIDNLVHIGHGAVIGENNLIVAGTVVGGSVDIGDRNFLGINCSIKQGIKIGSDSVIGMGAVVIHDVPDNTTVYGNPAK